MQRSLCSPTCCKLLKPVKNTNKLYIVDYQQVCISQYLKLISFLMPHSATIKGNLVPVAMNSDIHIFFLRRQNKTHIKLILLFVFPASPKKRRQQRFKPNDALCLRSEHFQSVTDLLMHISGLLEAKCYKRLKYSSSCLILIFTKSRIKSSSWLYPLSS